jgi:hypothetical protein
VSYKEFSTAVESIMNDVTVDAYILINHLLTMFFNNKTKVDMDELTRFFDEFKDYF